MSKTITRIYIVERNGAKPRLVRASSQAQALRHVVHDEYAVDVPTQEELIAAVADGAQVEVAANTAA